MGNRPMKISRGAPWQGDRRAENDGGLVSPSASESPSSKAQATAQLPRTEVVLRYPDGSHRHGTLTENEIYILVSAEEMEGGSPRENLEKSSEMPSVAVTSGSSEAACGILEDANAAPEPADSTTETLVKPDIQPSGLDFPRETCGLLLPEGSPTPPPKTYKASSSAEHTSDCPAVSEEEVAAELASVGTLSVGTAEPRKGARDLHPSSDLTKGTEGPGRDRKFPRETGLELTTDGAEEQSTGQREPDEAASEKSRRRTAEPRPNLTSAETPDRPPVITFALAEESLAEGQIDPQNHRPLSVSETEREIPEERSAAGSWKEREGFCPPNEVFVETELRPNDRKVPCRTRPELPTENTQVDAEEPATVQRQFDGETSLEKAADAESHLDSVLVETSGGASGMGTAPGTKQLAKTQGSLPGHDLPLAVTEMEGKVSRDGSAAENMGDNTKAGSRQVEMRPVEARDKMLARAEVEEKVARPVASNTPLEKELGYTPTMQSLSSVEETPTSDVQLLGDAKFLDAAQADEAGPPLEAVLPEAHTFTPAQPPAEVTLAQSSPGALLGTAETVKELEGPHLNQPLAGETTEEAGSPEGQPPPKAGRVSGTPLDVANEEEDAEFFDATDTCGAAEVPAGTRVLDDH